MVCSNGTDFREEDQFQAMGEFGLLDRIEGMLRLMRPLNASVAAVAVIFALFLTGETISWQVYIFAGLAAFFTTGHGMTVNDIVDYEVDQINAPFRTLPIGRLSMNAAKIWAGTLLFLACGFGLLIDVELGMIPFSMLWALGNSLILDMYNLYFKKQGLIGNFFVGWPPYALFLYADLVVFQHLTPEVQSIGLVGLFSIFGREVIKGIYDIDGDREHGIQTIAVRYGRQQAANLGSFIILLSVPSSIPLILLRLDQIVIPLFLGLFDLILIVQCLRLIHDPNDDRAYKTKLLIMQLMLIFLLILAIDQIISRI